MRIIELDEVDSTNEYIKRANFCEDTAVIARRQTAGRGTKGRSFISGEGGLYISVLRFYKDFNASEAFKIMVNYCVAVCRTLEAFKIAPVIRWANDVLAGGKKICGTLIENTFCGNKTVRSVVGVGINVRNKIPGELREIATSVTEQISENISVFDVKTEFLKNIENDYSVADYKRYINWFDRPVKIISGGAEKTVTALDISNDGRLVVKDGSGNITKISSAEVGLRL